MTTKADQPGFDRVQRQFELAHPFLEIIEERPRLVLMLKADDGVIRVADDNHVARTPCSGASDGPTDRTRNASRRSPGWVRSPHLAERRTHFVSRVHLRQCRPSAILQ